MKHQEPPRIKPTPLQQAKSHQKIARRAIAVIIGVIAFLIVGAIISTSGESAAEQQRLMNAIEPIVQLLVSLTTFALIGNQVSVAVGQIEQAEQSEARLLQLTAAKRTPVESIAGAHATLARDHRTAL